MPTAASAGRLQGRVAIVTGASRGLGRAIALAFAREGASVAVAARTEQIWNERLPGTVFETVQEIEKFGGVALPVRCDVSVESDRVELVKRVRGELGPIDVLINNAALTLPGRPPREDTAAPRAKPSGSRPVASKPGFLGFPLKGYQLHFEIGVFASFRLMQLVLPDMIEKRRGGIVNISSKASLMPGPGPYPDARGSTNFAYGGNKAALEHLTQAVAYEVAAHNIAVNGLLPSGAIETPGLLAMVPDVRAVDTPENFAEVVVKLAIADPKTTTGWVGVHDKLPPQLA